MPPRRAETVLAALAVLAAPQVAYAQSAAQQAAVAVGPGTLGEAVIALAAQTGEDIGLRDPSLANLPVPRVTGRMTARQALGRLLARAPVLIERVGPRGWVILRAPARRAAPPPPAPPPVLAPEPLPPQPEIVVSATKRGLLLASVPAAVSLIGEEAVLPMPDGANGAALAAQSVSVTSTHFGAGRNKLFIRGIADSGFSGPTQSTVGQYLGEMRIAYSAPDPDLRMHDVQRIEVLEGPQGTLYGAGSIGGIVRIVPQPPQPGETSGRALATATVTENGQPGYETVLVGNVPLAGERITLRANAYAAEEGGYVDDDLRGLTDVNRTRLRGGRAIIAMQVDEGWQINAMGALQAIDTRDAQYAEEGKAPLSRRSVLPQPFSQRYKLGSLSLKGGAGDLTLDAVIGVIDSECIETFDASRLFGEEAPFTQAIDTSIVSGEARVNYRQSGGLNALLGFSFLSGRSNTDRSLLIPSIGDLRDTLTNRLTEWTLFGEAGMEILPRLEATIGARLSFISIVGLRKGEVIVEDTKDPLVKASRNERIAAPSASLLWHLGSDTSAWLRFQRGYRPGGLAIEGGQPVRFRNDQLDTLELGLRFGRKGSSLLSGQVALSSSQWRDIQADIVTDVSGLPSTINIGNGQVRTAQASIAFQPSRHFGAEAAVLYNHSRLTAPSSALAAVVGHASGFETTLPNVADFNARLSLRYSGETASGWQWDVSAAARYTGKSRLGVGPRLDKLQGGFLQTSLVGRLRRDRLGLFVALANLIDDRSSRFGVGNPIDPDLPYQYVPQRPRSVTLGIDLAF